MSRKLRHLFDTDLFSEPLFWAIGGLLLLGGLSLATVLVRKQHVKSGGHLLRRGLTGLLWSAPVLMVLGVAGFQTLPHLQPQRSVENSGAPTDEAPWGDDYEVVLQFDEIPDGQRETEVTARPDWFHDVARMTKWSKSRSSVDHRGMRWRMCLESDEDVSIEEARANLAVQALEYATWQVRKMPLHGDWHPVQQNIAAHLVKREAVQTITNELSNGDSFDSYKVYWQIELNRESQRALAGQWREQTTQTRGFLLIGLGLLGTVMLGSMAVSSRLNRRSQGQHWLRLRLASLAFMVAAGLGYLLLLRNLVGT